MILVCDAYRKDLQHPNEFVRGSTLRFIIMFAEVILYLDFCVNSKNQNYWSHWCRRSDNAWSIIILMWERMLFALFSPFIVSCSHCTIRSSFRELWIFNSWCSGTSIWILRKRTRRILQKKRIYDALARWSSSSPRLSIRMYWSGHTV